MARIKVTPAEEDEVIVAGMPSGKEVDGASAVGANDAFVNEPPAVEQTPAPRQAPPAAESTPLSSTPSTQPASSPAPAPSEADGKPGVAKDAVSRSAPAAKQPKRAKDEYHETTLEDLESTSMPLAQRIVIVAAVVCIIGALIYYFVAMR